MEKNKKINDEYIFEVAFQFHRLGKYYGNTSDTHFSDIYEETIKLINKKINNMNPKEKAIELRNKFRDVRWDFEPDTCKECALIAVNEILNLCWNGNLDAKMYWEEVKKEIQNL